jgi:rubrerythrin
MEKSLQDLMAAFAGESQASRKYYHFAAVAEEEGYKQVARLFRAAAMAETIHAGNHLKAAGELKTTRENLAEAIKGEHYEHSEMYPAFLADSQAENNRKATRSFKYAMEVEKVHEALYTKALETLGSDSTDLEYYVCPICGHTHLGKPTDLCPVCGASPDVFIKVD